MWDLDNSISDFDKFLLDTNLIGAKTLEELEEQSKKLSFVNINNILLKEEKIDFSYEGLKDLHKRIFYNIYSWAGKDRYELKLEGGFKKVDTSFVIGHDIPKESKKIFLNPLLEYNKENVDIFLKDFSLLYANLNILHPFREGNGRTIRVFLNQLAKELGYALDLNKIPRDKLIEACIEANIWYSFLPLENAIRQFAIENISQLNNNFKQTTQKSKI